MKNKIPKSHFTAERQNSKCPNHILVDVIGCCYRRTAAPTEALAKHLDTRAHTTSSSSSSSDARLAASRRSSTTHNPCVIERSALALRYSTAISSYEYRCCCYVQVPPPTVFVRSRSIIYYYFLHKKVLTQ